MPAGKRRLKLRKPASRRSPQKPRATKTPKSSGRKAVVRRVKQVKVTQQKVAPPPQEILFQVEGKMSTFGGPHDLGMSPDEGLALFTKADLQDPKFAYLFLPSQPPGTSGLGRRLNPDSYYIGCRWNYSDTPRELLRRSLVRVENPVNGRAADARPVDWRPQPSTGRDADLSPGLAAALDLKTDDLVRVTIAARRAIPAQIPKPKRAGRAEIPKPEPAIRVEIPTPERAVRVVNLKLLKRIGYSNINTLSDDASAFFYESGLMIDADGAYHAYHPAGRSGLDYLANAGRPGNWWALVTDNGTPNGRPLIQTAADPAPGFYISTTSLQDPKYDRKDPRRYVNAEAVSFVVLPGKLNLGAKLGDFATVIRPATGASAYAVYADVGPIGKIGEGSIALAAALGIPSSPKTGGIAHGIVYLVFPGSAQGWPLSHSEINRYGGQLFEKWGGINMAKRCFPDLQWNC
jgi:hypothetical protein